MITDKQRVVLEEWYLRAGQLRNLRRVMASSMPTRKLKHFEKHILPGYLMRYRNAENKAHRVLSKIKKGRLFDD